MKIVTIIEARMSSSRLPGKVLKKTNDGSMTMIEMMVKRAQRSMLSDEVIVATTTNPKDDSLCEHLTDLDIKFYRGSEENVLQRVLDTALSNNADVIVEVTGDCPLLHHEIIDQSIGFFLKSGSDYVGNTCITNSYPRGQDVKVFSTKTLSMVNCLTSDKDDREHVSLYIYNNLDRFSCTPLPHPHIAINPRTRLTVDYPEDLDLVQKLVEQLGTECSLWQILDHMEKNPELIEINGNLDVYYINDDTRNA